MSLTQATAGWSAVCDCEYPGRTCTHVLSDQTVGIPKLCRVFVLQTGHVDGLPCNDSY